MELVIFLFSLPQFWFFYLNKKPHWTEKKYRVTVIGFIHECMFFNVAHAPFFAMTTLARFFSLLIVTFQSWALFHWSGHVEIDGLLRQSPNLLPARPCRDVVGLRHVASGAAVRQGEGCAVAKEALSGARKGRGANMALNVFFFFNNCKAVYIMIAIPDWLLLRIGENFPELQRSQPQGSVS